MIDGISSLVVRGVCQFSPEERKVERKEKEIYIWVVTHNGKLISRLWSL